MVDVKIKPKPKRDNTFDYTSVPYSGKDVTNAFVKGNSYNQGQDFYPDRIWRDEMSARNQWFQDKDFQSSSWGQDLNKIQKAIDAGKMPARNYGLAQDQMVSYLNDLQLRNTPRWNPNTKKHDGPMERPGGNYDFAPEDFMYLDALDKSRQKQFQKYNPRYGMSKEQIQAQIQEMEPNTSWHGYPYGEEKGASFLEEPGRYLLDNTKESLRTLAGDVAFLADYGGNVAGQALYPFDYEDERGNMYPRGFKDIIQHSMDVSTFEEAGYGVSPEAWADLGYSEKKDLQNSFQELTGSNYVYDPTYKPFTETGGITELAESLGEGLLKPSSDYSDMAVDIYDPWFTEDYFDWNPMKSAQVVGSVGTGGAGYGVKRAAQKYLPGLGKFIPSYIKKHPYLASLLGFTIPSAIEPFVEE